MDDRFKRPRNGTGRLNGTGKLPNHGAQENPFMVRLDPSSPPGEFNFMVEQPAELTRRVPQSGITAEAAGGIPPQLHQAVNEVLAFIYELDQQVERKGRKR
jgi:hypothetical protein